MNARKVKVKDEKEDYTCYYPFPCTRLPTVGPTGCQFTSIDVGIKNFAIRMEKRYTDGRVELLYFNKIDFRDCVNSLPDSSSSTSSTSSSTSLVTTSSTSLDILTISTVKEEIETDNKGTTKVNPSILNKVTKFLTSLLPAFMNAPESLICIERQLAVNYKSTRIYQHVITFFMVHAPSFQNYCMIVDVNPKLKGDILNAPKKLNYNELKAWSIQKAIEILQSRNDTISLSIIANHQGKSKTKADDLADTVIQLEALIQVLFKPVNYGRPR